MAKNSISKTFVWIILALVIVGLGGFGALNLSGNIRTIGTVGNKAILVDDYARQLQQEIRAIEAQTGETLPFQRAQSIGLDRAVLQRLVRQRALDYESEQIGLSIGDESLRERILDIPAFQGVDGSFDREGYRFALQQSGMNEVAFEISIREEAARTLLQGAIVGGVNMPETYAKTLVEFVGQKRGFTWTLLDASDLETPLPAPTEEDLRAYYDANADFFTLPATKRITYAVLSPNDLIDEVELTEEQLQQAYDERLSQYKQPERRLVERLVFADQDSADRAAAALEVSGTTFEALVQERGLALSDVDMGDVGRLELEAAGEAVFNAEVGDVVGPAPSPLGPALFRVNGVLPALDTSFEEARPELQDLLAADRARRLVEAQAPSLDDQLAGGATLEDLVKEADMTLGTIDWTPESNDDIAAYGDFQEAAAALSEEDFPQIAQLEDGSIFAMRLDEALPERPNPFEDAREAVAAAWTADQTVAALTARAEAALPDLTEGAAFSDAGFDAVAELGLTRNSFVEGAPADFMAAVFDMEVGEVRVLEDIETLAIVRLDTITAAEDDAQTLALRGQLAEQINQELAQGIFDIFSANVVQRAEPEVNPAAINAVHVNFP